ncbi:MAG: hypothetical protein HWQ23_10795 [Nostoc sp. JL33]|uniref:hypothetical protein n=1 Tax=Nostoc sp. JL33 TaxID=2815396 RepID=UPI0025E0912A|nr:hypothetical protein [Nostoc sp. JL33]MBN3870733.1 hypothetical protein [Nostoc sp. JL33]
MYQFNLGEVLVGATVAACSCVASLSATHLFTFLLEESGGESAIAPYTVASRGAFEA